MRQDRQTSTFFRRGIAAALLAASIAVGCSERGTHRELQMTLYAIEMGTIPTTGSGDSAPALELPVYLRLGAGGGYFTLDTGRRGVVELDPSGDVIRVAGKEGHGPGEVGLALGFDLAPDGSIWIADVGNGMIKGYDGTSLIAEFPVNHRFSGVATPDRGVWVAGDLRNSVIVRYDRAGRRIAEVGTPADTNARSVRFNQGVIATGTDTCAVLWAYTYRSRIDCYGSQGRLLWQAATPFSIAPADDAEPAQMSPEDEFAYVDVAASDGSVYALFIGGRASEGTGLRTTQVQMFDEDDGTYLGELNLLAPAKFIAVRDSTLAAMDYAPNPVIRVYRLRRNPFTNGSVMP